MQNRVFRYVLLAATAGVAGAWAPSTGPVSAAAPLQVYVTCSGTQCIAYAYGGSGSYVGIDWNWGYETWDTGATSSVELADECSAYPGYFIGLTATVTDSNGATAGGGGVVWCPQPPLH